MGLRTLVSYEASDSYVRLTKARGPKPGEKETIAEMETHLKAMKGKPRGPITPIIFSLTPSVSANDLLDPQVTTDFDLDGTHRGDHWPWLKPDTAGSITSGRQLFGSVTWWIFWRDGYQALAALDDNHDGWLSGYELTGLALWFDRNQNGRTDPGEVIPIEQTQIESIRVTSDSRDGHLAQEHARPQAARWLDTSDLGLVCRTTKSSTCKRFFACGYDTLLKEIFQDSLPGFLRLRGLPPVVEYLTVEFPNRFKTLPDLVVLLEGGIILHIELQSQNDPKIPWRCLDCWSAISQQWLAYQVIQILVYCGDEPLTMVDNIRRGRTDSGGALPIRRSARGHHPDPGIVEALAAERFPGEAAAAERVVSAQETRHNGQGGF